MYTTYIPGGVALVDQVALGVYIGILTGMFTALLVFSLAFVFQYVAGVAFPGTMGLMIGLGSAGLQGGMFRLMRDPAMLKSPVIVTALLIVLLVTNYSQKRGQDLGKSVPPKNVLLGRIRRRTLSPEVVKSLGRFGQVRVRVAGEVMDMEGYPPLPEDVRRAIREEEWTFPGDLPLGELERRLAEQLQTDHDLDDVAVRIDENGDATVRAAPPSSGLSRRVPEGKRAVALEATVPTGVAYGDEVRLRVGEESIPGSVVSVKPPEQKVDEKKGEDAKPKPAAATTAAGGKGRIGVAVSPGDVASVVGEELAQLVVEPRGQNREYELVSLLRQRGNGFRKLTVDSEGAFVDRRIGDLDLRATYGVDVLAIKRGDDWAFAPDGTTTIDAGDELFITGPTGAIATVTEATS